ncbi:YoaK family protein [Pedomonas mirosovicensis]|uniref:YoaK family protein n=1 Tax=Pedomonas mirosovicensis TaxID=2908641 RepID=UPI002167926A|nr:YoaK family protein [Pedomonas mirosovicensis]MCH8683928.1 DUF1275 domain-containing protein [Pedomonas mirosovicensis]
MRSASRNAPLAAGLRWLNALTGETRSDRADMQLGCVLAFVAGAVNAGGLLAVGHYTSHMTGLVSALAQDVAFGVVSAALIGLTALASFVTGAATCAFIVNWGRRAGIRTYYALPLLIEAALLLVFALSSRGSGPEGGIASTIALLCLLMGLQNAIITKISGARIRTTHVTGIVTDIGIELGKLLYWNRDTAVSPPVIANRAKLRLLSLLFLAFFCGATAGAIGFHTFGNQAALPLALLVFLLGLPACFRRQAAARN